MNKCQTCVHYHYYAGVAPSISKKLGKEYPTRPTNYCEYAKMSWERKSAEVKKPNGIPCNYYMKDMFCNDCGKKLKNNSDIWMILTNKLYICKKCGNKKEENYKKGE
jgi:hypothetical protein